MNENKGAKTIQFGYASTPKIVGHTPRGNLNGTWWRSSFLFLGVSEPYFRPDDDRFASQNDLLFNYIT